MTLAAIDQAIAGGARLEPACKVAGVDPRTVQRWRARPGDGDQRRGPRTRPGNQLTRDEEAEILALATSAEFWSLSPHQLVAKLADLGIYIASESSIYRLLRRKRLLQHRDRARPRTHRRPREHVATGPNQVWAWDITYLGAPVRGTYWYLYTVMDVWSRKIVAWDVHDTQTDELAALLIEEACRREGVVRDRLVLHADNGAAMKGKTMLAKLEELGVMPSFSRPRVSDDNPFPEALFRTLKYRPGYPERPFLSLNAARSWVAGFVAWYNDDHQHSGIRFVTPGERHDGRDVRILAHRHQVYLAARDRNPARWSRHTRNWTPISTVRLNPEHGASSLAVSTPLSTSRVRAEADKPAPSLAGPPQPHTLTRPAAQRLWAAASQSTSGGSHQEGPRP
jgi:putative transposase